LAETWFYLRIEQSVLKTDYLVLLVLLVVFCVYYLPYLETDSSNLYQVELLEPISAEFKFRNSMRGDVQPNSVLGFLIQQVFQGLIDELSVEYPVLSVDQLNS